MLALRLSNEDKDLLDELVRKRAARLEAEGGAVSASSIIRSLIRQAAKDEAIEPPRDAATRPPKK